VCVCVCVCVCVVCVCCVCVCVGVLMMKRGAVDACGMPRAREPLTDCVDMQVAVPCSWTS
jgi:hypothetical protein